MQKGWYGFSVSCTAPVRHRGWRPKSSLDKHSQHLPVKLGADLRKVRVVAKQDAPFKMTCQKEASRSAWVYDFRDQKKDRKVGRVKKGLGEREKAPMRQKGGDRKEIKKIQEIQNEKREFAMQINA